MNGLLAWLAAALLLVTLGTTGHTATVRHARPAAWRGPGAARQLLEKTYQQRQLLQKKYQLSPDVENRDCYYYRAGDGDTLQSLADALGMSAASIQEQNKANIKDFAALTGSLVQLCNIKNFARAVVVVQLPGPPGAGAPRVAAKPPAAGGGDAGAPPAPAAGSSQGPRIVFKRAECGLPEYTNTTTRTFTCRSLEVGGKAVQRVSACCSDAECYKLGTNVKAAVNCARVGRNTRGACCMLP